MIDWKDKKEFWISGARIADPGAGRIRTGSILIRRGVIEEITWQKKVKTDLPVLEADGLLLAPGFIDIHTHLREPGSEDKETIETGTAAAAAGGYTAVVCMANTNPVIDDPSIVEYILKRYSDRVFLGVGIPYNSALISRDEIREMGERLARLDPSLQVCVLDYRPEFRSRIKRPSYEEMRRIHELLRDCGLKTVICQTQLGHIGP